MTHVFLLRRLMLSARLSRRLRHPWRFSPPPAEENL